MTQEQGTPPGFWERVEQVCERVLARYIRSGALRNASISGGNGLTIKGGFFRMRNAANTSSQFYIGAVNPAQPDGTPQPGWVVRRSDGTLALALYDAFPDAGPSGVNQALTWWDRDGHVVLSDDTDSGEGIGRPWLPLPRPVPGALAAWPSTTSATFGTVAETWPFMQHPKLWWKATAITDAGVTGEVRLSVNGTVLGATHTVAAGGTTQINELLTLPAGFWAQEQVVRVEAQVTGGAGALRVQTWALYGRQS